MYSCTLTFQTLLGSFVQRTCRTTSPLFSSTPFPLFCECKDTAFSFPSNSFWKNFSFILYFFFIRCISAYCRIPLQTFCLFYDGSDPENPPFMTLSAWILKEKYHKLTRKPEKHERSRLGRQRKMPCSCTRIYTNGNNLFCSADNRWKMKAKKYTLLINIGKTQVNNITLF